MRDATERIVFALERIADAIERALPEPPGPCLHPEDQRDFAGATMGHPRWTCTACGYVYDAQGVA